MTSTRASTCTRARGGDGAAGAARHPSVVIGWPTIGALLFGDYFGTRSTSRPRTTCCTASGRSSTAPGPSCCTALRRRSSGWPSPGRARLVPVPGPADAAGAHRQRAGAVYTLLANKFYFDAFNERFIAGGSRALGNLLWRGGDVAVIDGALVNGSRASWLARQRGARRAVRLPLPLCLRDDHRLSRCSRGYSG